MTEKEWVVVTTALTDLFDIVKASAPERINIDKMYKAAKILTQEHDRIRAKGFLFTDLVADGLTSTGWKFKNPSPDWQQKNDELEKKKEAQRAQDMNDLSDTLKQSIEKINHERKEEK